MVESSKNAKKRKAQVDLVHRLHARIKESDETVNDKKTTQTPNSMQSASGLSIKDWDEAAGEKKTKGTPQCLQSKYGLSMAPYAASELAHFSHERLVKYIADLQEQVTKETLQLFQPAHGLSMAPYAASELAHFSNERLVKYIIDLQEQIWKVKSDSPIKAEEEPTHTPLTPMETKAAEKESGLPFFGDAIPGMNFDQEKAFHLEVMRARATMKNTMLEHLDKKYPGSKSSAFGVKIQSKRVVEELFGPVPKRD